MDTSKPTRLILSNLPPSLTTPLLRTHLNKCPPAPPSLTDLKIVLKPDGTSRRIAFAGFRDSAEADRVRTWVAGTWVQGSAGGARVRVDWAKDAQDAPPPKKRVKLSPPPSSSQPSTGFRPDAASAQGSDDRFAEFMSVMAPRRNRALDDPVPSLPVVATARTDPTQANNLSTPVPLKDSPTEPLTGVEHLTHVGDGIAEDDAVSDMEYMAKRMKRTLDAREEDDIAAPAWEQEPEESGVERAAALATDEPALVDEAHQIIAESGRLFIRNLAFSITESELRELLEPFGELQQVHIPLDSSTKLPKGLAYATFVAPDCALRAFEELDLRSFQGRLLHVLPAIGRKALPSRDDGATTLKKDRLDARKQDAGKGLSWATLYMNSDAVMSSIADRLNVSKSELLDPAANNAAVRVALAETHVIAETKKHFEAEGVDLASFTSKGARSSTTILVKNIPYGTTTSTLAALFSPFGPLARVVLPPSGTMAIVEMANASDASDAWRGLVYKKLGSSVLYLEKAPAGVWNGTVERPVQPVPVGLPRASASTSTLAEESKTSVEGATLFVKNLSFNTTTEALQAAFAHLPEFVFARVQTKPDPKNSARTLSMGFGFVGFRSASSATAAREARDGFLLDGHQLEVRFAQRGKDVSQAADPRRLSSSSSTTTKLLVKNVPFEVTRKEIRELFSAYGQLKSVRLPRKFDHKTRGFAFLDFASRRDAEAAFAALEHTHLLGRHLVLQWAEEGEAELEELRARTGFSEGKIGGKKAKFSIGDGAAE